MRCIEKVQRFGPEGALCGVLTDPPPSQQREHAPAVLLLTAGFLHRVGPHRLHVDLARRFAMVGFPAMRFDMSGVGDSGISTTMSPDQEGSTHDVVQAMSHLAESRGAQRFVLIGLCSGAGAAYEAAMQDERVVGAVLLDGPAYPTLGYHIRFFGSRLLDPARMIRGAKCRARVLSERTLRGLQALAGGPFKPADVEQVSGDSGVALSDGDVPVSLQMSPPTRDRLARDLASLHDRGTHVLFVYTAEAGGYLYESQFDDMFPSLKGRDRISHAYYSSSDHTFTPVGERTRLMDQLVNWASSV